MIRTEDKTGGARAFRMGLMMSSMLVPAALHAQATPANDPAKAGAAVAANETNSATTNSEATSGDAAENNGEIVVTAQKRAESIQRVPISLQALGTETLQQHQVVNFDDYVKLLPSVSYQSFGPGQSQLSFRGIISGGDGLPGGSLPTAGVYLDEIPVTTIGSLLDVHIYDVARVEALSGPQGTLFGASSLAGTLRIITNKPDPSKFSAGYDLQGNKYGKGNAGGQAEGFVNIPLNENAAIRLVGYYTHTGGYIDNTPGTRNYVLDDADPTTNLTIDNSRFVKKNFNDSDDYGGRVALRLDLNDNWTVTPQLIAQHLRTHGSFLYDPRVGDLKVHDFQPDRTTDKWYQAALTIEGKVSNFDIVYSGGYLQRSIDLASDYSYYTVYYDTYGLASGSPAYITNFPRRGGGFLDPTQLFHNHQAITKQTHELRISSPTEDRLRFTAGMFFQRQANKNRADYNVPGTGTLLAPGTPGPVPVFGDDLFITNTHIVDRDYSAFAQATFDLTDTLSLTGGVRGFIAKNTLVGFSGFPSNARAAGCTVPITLGQCISINKRVNESGETHKATIQWQATPDKMVYATYSTGFRPGGNNRRAGINPYDPDTLDNYEFGWKTSWLDHTLRINGAVYYEEWKKLQYALSPVGSAGVANIYNAGDARVYGAEVDFSWIIAHHLTLSGTGAYNDAKLKTSFCQIGASGNPDCTLGTVAAPKGTRLPIQPRFKVSGTARYDFTLGTTDSFLQGTVLHQSNSHSALGTNDNAVLGNTPAFTTFDFSGGVKFGSINIEAFIQNAFDKRGQLSRNTFCAVTYCGQYYRIFPIKPQLFGLKVSQRF